MSHKTKAEKMRAVERSVHQTQKKTIDSPSNAYSVTDLTKSMLLTGDNSILNSLEISY